MNTAIARDDPALLDRMADLLAGARRVLAMSHLAPDGDAIGSLLGLGSLLHDTPRELASAPRQVVLACADPIPSQLAFLPGAAAITARPGAGPWDAVVALDTSDAQRLGSIFKPADYGAAPVMVLDHHVTNAGFGTLNYVDTSAAATAQIVVRLADALGTPISAQAATCLLAGIVTDTLSFRTHSVTPEVLRVAARLLACGADLAEITAQTLNRRTTNVMRLWGAALSGLRIEGAVIWTHITREMRTRAGAPANGNVGLAEYLLSAPEAKVSAVFSETAVGTVEISLRARPGHDVAQLALSLGGGGHPQAAGCTIPGPLAEAEARVLPLLQEMAARSAQAGPWSMAS